MRIVLAHASETALMEVIVAIADTLQKVMLVGHNPRLTVLTNTIGDGAISNIPTSGACYIALAVASWWKIWKLHGNIKYFEYPKKHIR
jgi:phosphohistidine phosphatase